MKFQLSTKYYSRILNRNDIEFFYYCICNERNDSFLDLIDWNIIVKPFLEKLKIKIEFSTSNKAIPKECPKNTIYLHFNSDLLNSNNKVNKETECASLFRHCRNSFTHFRIQNIGKEYLLTDQNDKNTLTMNGQVEIDKFHKLIYYIITVKDDINSQIQEKNQIIIN